MFGELLAKLRGGTAASDPASVAKVEAAVSFVRSMARPCLRLARDDDSRSYLGGGPCLPDGCAWPRRGQVPLRFLAQLDLGEIRQAGGPEWLPPAGCLLFFYDDDYGMQWSGHPNSQDAVSVIHVPPEVETHPTSFPPDLPKAGRYRSYRVGYSHAASLPSYERYMDLIPSLSNREADALDERLDDQEAPNPQHQIGGYPNPIQDDAMEGSWEARGEERTALPDQEANSNEGEDDEWRLLLQLDSDDGMGTSWGHAGRLYFWIREREAAAAIFSNTWVTVQFF